MADNVEITAGTGTTIATDDCTTGHAQLVKLAYSADGSRTHVPADADGMLVNLGTNNDVTVTGTVTANAGTNLNTSALALESGGNLASIKTAVELIDDTVKVLGTDTYTEATSKGLVVGAVRKDFAGTLANTDNEISPLQVNSSGQLRVSISGVGSAPTDAQVTPTELSWVYNFPSYYNGATWDRVRGSATDGLLVNLGTNNDVTVTGTVAVTQSGTWDEVGINDSGNSITVDNGGTFATQVDGAALTALQLIDDPVFADDAAFTVGTSKVMMSGIQAVAHGSSPDTADALDAGAIIANRHRIPFMLGGHPNLQSSEYITTTAASDDNILPAISAGTIYVITGITVTASAANTVNTSVRIGFGATTVPSQGASQADAVAKVVLSHPAIAPGSGVVKGHAGGIVGIGGDGEELRITTGTPTSGSIVVQVDWFTIAS